MMDLLKRFEEDNLDDDPFANSEYSDDEGAGGDGNGGDDLERRLAGIDLGEYCVVPWYDAVRAREHRTILCRECFRGQNMGCLDY